MIRVFRPLGPRVVPMAGEVGDEFLDEAPDPVATLLELLLTLAVGLEGVMLEIELDRSFVILSQSSHSQALESRRSIMFLRKSECCSASSLYWTWEHSLWRERVWKILNWVVDSRRRASFCACHAR